MKARGRNLDESTSSRLALAVKPSYGSPEQLAEFTQAEFVKYGKVIKASNIKAD